MPFEQGGGLGTTDDFAIPALNDRVTFRAEGHNSTDFHQALDRGYQWGDEIPVGLFWRRTDLPSLEDQEPVLHTGEGPLAWRKLGITSEQAKGLVQKLL